MKIINKVAVAILGLVSISAAVHAQSLDDAKKAINAEQYQKAKGMLQNLTTTQPTKGENYFYLGWVYIKQEEPDSAKLWFNKGIAADPKQALNFVGLGAVAKLDKDANGVTTNFNQALTLTSKKDDKPYVYMGKTYLFKPATGAISAADADAAIAILTKGQAASDKDPELFITLGDAYEAEVKGTDAFTAYQTAQTLDPKSTAALVALGVTAKYANAFDEAEAKFQAAIAIDPNYGPAYREWAETDLRWSQQDAKQSAKAQQAADLYKKYLSLTDLSIQSRMRYADFLISAKDYTTLQQEATELSKAANSNLRVYRYLGYSAYENKDYANGLTAMNTWITKADPKRIIPLDYVYLGRLQIASGQDTLGVSNLKKAYALDTTQTDILGEIAKADYTNKQYVAAGNEYKTFISKGRKVTLNDYLSEGLSFYKAFGEQYYSKATPKPVADTSLLTKADTAFAYIQAKATTPNATVALYQARAKDFREPDRNSIQGIAKPYYEKYISIVTAKGVTPADKSYLAEAYAYLGRYYEFKEKNDAKAMENYSKALENDPTDASAKNYMARKGKK